MRLTASKSGPDVKMSSTNGSIGVSLWLQGTLERPAVVEVTTSNGRVDLTVQRESAINVTAKSSNGGMTINLPEDFDGLVTLRSTNGKKRLGEGMEGVIFPNEGDAQSITYRIRPNPHRRPAGSGPSGPSVGGLDKLGKEQEYAPFREINPELHEDDPTGKGPDRASASTTNGSVKVQYIGTEEESGGGGSTCCIM